MAKVVLVSLKANRTTWQLALALKQQQHEVVLLTSQGEAVNDTCGIEFMAYFKKWSALEAFKIIPGLFGMRAQILHLLLEEDDINPAQLVLATFAKSHPHCILTTSLLHIRKGLIRSNPVRYVVEESDIVTCATVEAMGELRGLNVRMKRQGRGILPPALSLTETRTDDFEISEAEQKITQHIQNQKFVLMPFQEKSFEPESTYFLNLKVLAQKYSLVLWGSYAHWNLRERKQFNHWMQEHGLNDRWLVTGEISSSLTNTLFQKCEVFMIAGQSFTPTELTEYFMMAVNSNSTLVLDSTQANVHSSLWKNGQNCWILPQGRVTSELVRLASKPIWRMDEPLSQQVIQEKHWLDHPLNELNRLYNRALEQKT